MKPTFGIIGNGVVGKAHIRAWAGHVSDCKIYDADPVRSVDSLEETAAADYVFISVPTDRRPGSYECNTDIVEEVFKKLAAVPKCGTVVVRSTVPIGFCREMTKLYGHLVVLHHPEFVTETSSHIDAFTPSRNLIGYTSSQCSIDVAHRFGDLCRKRFPGVPVFTMSTEETEYVKLAMNVVWAVKVGLFNELRVVADAADLDWEHCREAMLTDGRITHSHTQVPGPDGKRGFGGKCLPKDLANLITGAKKLGVDTPIMKAVWTRNEQDRDDQRL